jgi:hypothetical protein
MQLSLQFLPLAATLQCSACRQGSVAPPSLTLRAADGPACPETYCSSRLPTDLHRLERRGARAVALGTPVDVVVIAVVAHHDVVPVSVPADWSSSALHHRPFGGCCSGSRCAGRQKGKGSRIHRPPLRFPAIVPPNFTRIHVERLGSRRDATQSTQEDGHDQTTTGRYHPNSAENVGRLGSSPPGASAEVRTPPCRDDAPSTPPAPTVPHALAAELRGRAPDCVLGTSEARGPGSPGRRCPISCPPARFHATNA